MIGAKDMRMSSSKQLIPKKFTSRETEAFICKIATGFSCNPCKVTRTLNKGCKIYNKDVVNDFLYNTTVLVLTFSQRFVELNKKLGKCDILNIR